MAVQTMGHARACVNPVGDSSFSASRVCPLTHLAAARRCGRPFRPAGARQRRRRHSESTGCARRDL